MPGFNRLTVDDQVGPHWELALSLIESGEAPVRLGPAELYRWTSGPNADGTIHISVDVSRPVVGQIALESVRQAREAIDSAAASDPRFADLLRKHGCRWEVVHNYGMGAVLIAVVDDQGDIISQPGLELAPSTHCCSDPSRGQSPLGHVEVEVWGVRGSARILTGPTSGRRVVRVRDCCGSFQAGRRRRSRSRWSAWPRLERRQ
jgi:hypothetical protein